MAFFDSFVYGLFQTRLNSLSHSIGNTVRIDKILKHASVKAYSHKKVTKGHKNTLLLVVAGLLQLH